MARINSTMFAIDNIASQPCIITNIYLCLFNLENKDIHKNETNMYNKNVLKRLFLVIHRRWVLFNFKYNNR